MNTMPDRPGLRWMAQSVPYLRYSILSSYPQLSHAVFTRLGGTSRPPYDRLNTSYDVGDLSCHVAANLDLIKSTLGAGQLTYMEQVHGTRILVIRRGDEVGRKEIPAADAVITNAPDLAVLVKQADCQGIILFDPDRNVVAVIHCGWRGNVANILKKVAARMRIDFGCEECNLLACIGPSLGPCCAEFVDYKTIFPDDFQAFRVKPDYFDLKAISRWQLLNAGLRQENIQISDICTRCRTDLFYSYRGEGRTGRFGTVAMLRQGEVRHANVH
ncbi:MAG: peptidoglycan editing factor PgeF [Deltaproteobacteria bacterium]|nr:peptidoglycan editing factor PgeF [Deltaproteobacteria bacterium]